MELNDYETRQLRAAIQGDPRAFTAMCDRSRNRVWRIIASVAKGPDVDDLAQEAIIRAWNALKSFRGDASFESWLCRIALNVAHDYVRSAWKRRVLFWKDDPIIHEEGEEPESMVVMREMQRAVRKGVASLPEHQRSVIWLHYFEGYSFAEIGRLENVSESTLRSRVHAGLKRLSTVLKDLPQEGQDFALFADAKSGACFP